MAIFDGDINHIGDDVSADDATKAKDFLSKLDPIDEMQKQDGAKFKAAVKKLLESERDPQSVEDGQRIFAALKKLFGSDEIAEPMAAPALPTGDGVVDTGVLTGSRDGLKNFLIKKSRDKETQE